MKKMFFMLCVLGALVLMVGCSLQAYNPDSGNFSITVELPDYLASKQVTNGRLIHPDAEVLEASISTASDGSIVATSKQSLGGKDAITLNFEDVPLDELLKLSIEVYTDIVGDVGTVKQVFGTHESTFGPLKAGGNNLKVGIVPTDEAVIGRRIDGADRVSYVFNDAENIPFENKLYIFGVQESAPGFYYVDWDGYDDQNSIPPMTLWNSNGLRNSIGFVKVFANDHNNYFFYSDGKGDFQAYITVQGSEDYTAEISFNINSFDESLVLTYAHTNGGQNIISFVTDESNYLGASMGPLYAILRTYTVHNPYSFDITLQDDAKIDYQGYIDDTGEVTIFTKDAFSFVDQALPQKTKIPSGGTKDFTVKYAPEADTKVGGNYVEEEAILTLSFDNDITYTCTLSGLGCM